jgi:hypothetical protein
VARSKGWHAAPGREAPGWLCKTQI